MLRVRARRTSIGELGDLTVEPVTLEPAIGSLVRDSDPPGVPCSIDGEARGESPATLDGVCAGPTSSSSEQRRPRGRADPWNRERASRLRAGSGRPSRRARPLPAPRRIRGLRSSGFSAAETVVLYAPPADVVKEVLTQSGATAEWFGVGDVDANRPVDLRERVRRLADGFDAQGVAWVQPVRPGATEVRSRCCAGGHGAGRDDRDPRSAREREAGADRLNTPLVLYPGSLGAW